MNRILLLSILILMVTITYGQQREFRGNFSGSVSGSVIDAADSVPLEYVNIILFSKRDSSMVEGGITNSEGKFNIKLSRPGFFYMTVDFIGYEKRIIDSVFVMPKSPAFDAGTITLEKTAIEMDEVEVEGERVIYEYKIDKKIINVSQDLTSIGGTAIDALQKSPSITVDVEGNVSLRGSTNFTVLIDGKPTIMDANDALEQIPASTIETIELITNPSAKYDPEGTTGIINVVLKKNALAGVSGEVDVNAGSFDQYGIEVIANYRTDDISWTLSGDYNERVMPGNYYSSSSIVNTGGTFNSISKGDMERDRYRYHFSSKLDWTLSDYNSISFSGRYGSHDGARLSDVILEEWTSNDPTLFTTRSDNENSREGTHYSAEVGYEHIFGTKDNKLNLYFEFESSNGEEKSINKDFDGTGGLIQAKRYYEKDDPEYEIRLSADYNLPINENSNLELGYRSEWEMEEGLSETYLFDQNLNEYVLEPQYSHLTDTDDNNHAVYTTYSNMIGDFGFKLGIRGEYTDRKVTIVETNEDIIIDRADFFPTLHLSYSIDETTQFMTSYSRRIRRPRGWYLEPYETWMNANNVRKGNPGLEPQFINSFEAGIVKHYNTMTFSVEGYYRATYNNIERVRTVYPDSQDVFLHTFANAGTSEALGVEGMFNVDLWKMWNISLLGSIYNFKQEGEVFGESFDSETVTWNTSLNTNLALSERIKMQFSGRYFGPSTTAQGERDGFFMADAAFRYEILLKVLSATVQVRDIFSTANHVFESYGTQFSSYTEFNRQSPSVMLTLSYKFNGYRDKSRGMDDGGGMDMDNSEF